MGIITYAQGSCSSSYICSFMLPACPCRANVPKLSSVIRHGEEIGTTLPLHCSQVKLKLPREGKQNTEFPNRIRECGGTVVGRKR
ncbi:hypothetical protein POVWA2_050190 [Plasmodium ovale wallikeri]|uniref:Uncharacterized protein n=1 Tax=Plasmodium ovale wallikeri TaxID=864142 RepID=A0A1A8YG04_PLAOA|nr:hypothetical protein POVWA1_001210 [Plasmodium ovale wallikeri]SBT45548.1 hypothetical protein POVWA2_050190 [Plasmodium ovale wallikeri]